MNRWHQLCALEDIEPQSARVFDFDGMPIAVFRSVDDAVFAVEDRCPHRLGPLSQGIVHGRSVTCPLHGWVIHLEEGVACEPDVGCVRTFSTRVVAGRIAIEVPVVMPKTAA